MRIEDTGRYNRMDQLENKEQLIDKEKKHPTKQERLEREDYPSDNIQNWDSLGDRDW